MKPNVYSQLLLIIVVIGIFVLTVLDKPLPGPLLLVLGVLCPSPAQIGAILSASAGGGK